MLTIETIRTVIRQYSTELEMNFSGERLAQARADADRLLRRLEVAEKRYGVKDTLTLGDLF